MVAYKRAIFVLVVECSLQIIISPEIYQWKNTTKKTSILHVRKRVNNNANGTNNLKSYNVRTKINAYDFCESRYSPFVARIMPGIECDIKSAPWNICTGKLRNSEQYRS